MRKKRKTSSIIKECAKQNQGRIAELMKSKLSEYDVIIPDTSVFYVGVGKSDFDMSDDNVKRYILHSSHLFLSLLRQLFEGKNVVVTNFVHDELHASVEMMNNLVEIADSPNQIKTTKSVLEWKKVKVPDPIYGNLVKKRFPHRKQYKVEVVKANPFKPFLGLLERIRSDLEELMEMVYTEEVNDEELGLFRSMVDKLHGEKNRPSDADLSLLYLSDCISKNSKNGRCLLLTGDRGIRELYLILNKESLQLCRKSLFDFDLGFMFYSPSQVFYFTLYSKLSKTTSRIEFTLDF